MPTPNNNDLVSVMIAGRAHSDWSSYEIDSQLMTPGDAWRVELSPPAGGVPAAVVEGARVEVRVGRDTVLIGNIDDIDEEVAHGRHTLTLSGRDGAGVLLDCSAPIFTSRQVTLAQVVANVVRPLGITKVKIAAKSTYTTEKINVEPGDRAWEVLQNAAEANGLWPWFAPDGTLVIGGPNYSAPPVAALVLRVNGKGNNVESLRRTRSMAGRFSQVTVLGQRHGTAEEEGESRLRGSATDPAVKSYRPTVVVDYDSVSAASALSRARKLLMDSRLKALTITAKVTGHRTSAGVLWTPGQRVQVQSEPHGINGVFFLMGRKFVKGRGNQGSYTQLTLKEDKTWIIDAHGHKKHRRRRDDDGPSEIVNDVE
ncbi:phage baseplate assembly protein [Chromobacterium vaccinii]|uniref:phage baseplate assembly protein n=1 Tax=Chromobacterium vaccinii TaxID=1108595 RepID=UPI003C793605